MRRANEPDLADRIQAALPADDPDLIAEVKALERLALNRTVHVAANNKFPHWGLERWMAVISGTIAIVGAIVGGVFVLGGEWGQLKQTHMEIQQDIHKIEAQIKAGEAQLWLMRREIQGTRVKREP